MHLRTAHMAYSECLPTVLTPLAERACCSFPLLHLISEGCVEGCMGDHITRYCPQVGIAVPFRICFEISVDLGSSYFWLEVK